jgi:F0F1-type ATP synthase membrane subunit b/b'
MKTTLTAELESYKAELAETQTKNKDTLADLDRKLIEEKAKLQKELAQKLGEIKQNSEQEVINRLDSTTKKILVENEKLMMDLRLHVKETEEQGKRIAALQEENQRLKRELELNEQVCCTRVHCRCTVTEH